MARKANQVLWDQWRRRIKRQRESGLSIAEFCRREDIPRQGFHVWKRKLHAAISAQQASREATQSRRFPKARAMAAAGRPPRRAPTKPTMPAHPTDFLQLPIAAAQGCPWIELALADGTILRLPQQNLAALVAVLRVLRGERLELPGGERGHA
jgi:hypothetical protein